MNLDELRSVQSKERQRDSPQHLRESFYADVGEYIADLKERRERAASEADDPFGAPEVGRLNDEIETAEEVAESIFERRMGKVVKQASLAAVGMASDDDALTAEERALYDDIVDRIRENKHEVLSVLDGRHESSTGDGGGRERGTPDAERSTASGEASDTPPTGDASDVDAAAMGDGHADDRRDDGAAVDGANEDRSAAADRDGGAGGPDGTETAGGDVDQDGGLVENRVRVRITEDVGAILGVDRREYDLAAEDVVAIPAANADPLVDRDAAERLE